LRRYLYGITKAKMDKFVEANRVVNVKSVWFDVHEFAGIHDAVRV